MARAAFNVPLGRSVAAGPTERAVGGSRATLPAGRFSAAPVARRSAEDQPLEPGEYAFLDGHITVQPDGRVIVTGEYADRAFMACRKKCGPHQRVDLEKLLLQRTDETIALYERRAATPGSSHRSVEAPRLAFLTPAEQRVLDEVYRSIAKRKAGR